MNTPSITALEATGRLLADQASFHSSTAKVLLKNANHETYAEVVAQDVYEALTEARSLDSKEASSVAVVSCGWAAPILGNKKDKLAPSEHPKRRRVCLVAVHDLSTGETVSTIRFEDDNEVIVNYGTAKGSLADALNKLASSLLKKR